MTCGSCKGEGKIGSTTCDSCKGKDTHDVEEPDEEVEDPED